MGAKNSAIVSLYNLQSFRIDCVLGMDVPDSYREISKCVNSMTSSCEYPASKRNCCIRAISSF